MISSTSNPRVKNIVSLQKKGKERRQQGLFVIEGKKLFEEILRDAKEALCDVYVTEAYLEADSQRKMLAGVSYETVSDNVMKTMAETMEPQGILATVRIPRYDKKALLAKEDAVWIALEDLRDPGNLGTVLRTAEAAGVTGVLLSAASVDMYNPKVVRSTMGAIFRVPHFYAEDFLEELKDMKRCGATLYAAHLAGTQYYDEPEYAGRSVILIGNEANGLSEEASKMADCLVKIPMEGKAESLNAAVATSLFVYEAYRKRRNRA
ncbi:MAG: RNA methyltransferase [Lachnospiraceae bacterium]|nr:RNA methyltransferase [Lachnospiraceae bacterium]